MISSVSILCISKGELSHFEVNLNCNSKCCTVILMTAVDFKYGMNQLLQAQPLCKSLTANQPQDYKMNL